MGSLQLTRLASQAFRAKLYFMLVTSLDIRTKYLAFQDLISIELEISIPNAFTMPDENKHLFCGQLCIASR